MLWHLIKIPSTNHHSSAMQIHIIQINTFKNHISRRKSYRPDSIPFLLNVYRVASIQAHKSTRYEILSCNSRVMISPCA